MKIETKTRVLERNLGWLALVLAAAAGCAGGIDGEADSPEKKSALADPSGAPIGSTGGVGTAATPGARSAVAGGSTGAAGTGGSGGSTSGPATATAPAGSFGNVGVSGGQDFAAFRRALDEGRIPARDTLEAAGFFAEHYTALPPPTCGRTFCLHGMLGVSRDLARGGTLTLLQMAMNSPIDPATIKKPPLNLAVVLDHSGSMAAAGKMDFAKQGVKLLIDALDPQDTFTLIVFDDKVDRLFGPARVTDKAALKGVVGEIQPAGGTNIYSALEASYQAVLGARDDSEQRRVIFLTDGLPTVGTTDAGRIRAMSTGYNQKYVGLTTIGLGRDVNLALLRGLAESGGGNFYYVERPEAVKEVFTEELSFFVAPIAYDLELGFSELPGYTLKAVHGTALWQALPGGGKVSVPSVFLVSRTSTAPGATGGRRGGGSAIMAELAAVPGTALARPHPVGKLTLRYRLPGSREVEQLETVVQYPEAAAGTSEETDFYSYPAVEKNTLILSFFFAFREATQKAQADVRAALDGLTTFRERIAPRLAEWRDEDLLDDLKILDRYIEVLRRAAPTTPRLGS